MNTIIDGYLADRQPVVRAYPTLVAAAKPLRRHLGDPELDHLTKERIRFYMSRRRAEGHMVGPADARRKKLTQDGTIIRELVMLRSALKLAVQEKWISSAPHIETPHQPAPRDRWLTREEADRLIESAVAPHVRLFLQLALYTAARAAALLDLKWPAVDFAGGLIDLGTVSGGKSRSVVPMGPKLRAALMTAREIATCPFVIEHGGKQVASLKTGTRAAAMRANLPGVTPHILRHTAATWMAQRGVAMRDIAKYLGTATPGLPSGPMPNIRRISCVQQRRRWRVDGGAGPGNWPRKLRNSFPQNQVQPIEKTGAAGGDRTLDLSLTKGVLYH